MADQPRRPIPQDAILPPPGLLQAITADDSLQALTRLVELTEAQIPVGRAVELNFTVNDPITTEPRRIDLKPPWFSIEAINDGDTVLLLHVNVVGNNPIRITPDDHSIHFDYDIGIIEVVYLQAESGSGTGRLVGTF